MEETKTLSASKSRREPKLEVMLYLLAKKPSKKSDQAAAENIPKYVRLTRAKSPIHLKSNYLSDFLGYWGPPKPIGANWANLEPIWVNLGPAWGQLGANLGLGRSWRL